MPEGLFFATLIMRLYGLSLAFFLFAISAPGGAGVGSVKVSGMEANAFRLSWDAVDGAEGYVVNVWTNGVIGASEGTEVLGERFSGVPNRNYVQSWSMNDINGMGDYGHWVGEGMRGYEAKSADDSEPAIVLGLSAASGWLCSEPLELSKETIVRLRLTRHTEKDTAPVLIAFLKNGETNFAESVSFGTAIHSFSDYTVVASNLTNGCQLLIASQKTGGKDFGRVAVSEISVVSGHSSGRRIVLPVVNDLHAERTSHLLERTSPVPYFFSVAAQGESVDETPAVGEVDMGDPPWLRCWRASDFLPKPGFRALDLSGMGKVTKRAWVNGEDGDGLYAFSDVDLRPYSSNAIYRAVYQFNAGTKECWTNALGMLVSGEVGLRLVLPIRLDAKRPLKELSVAYALRSLYRKNASKDTKVAFSWKVGDGIDAMEDEKAGWTVEEDGGWVAVADVEERVLRQVKIPRRTFQDAKYLFLQWGVPKQGNSVMIGLSDLVVSGLLKDAGFSVTIR